MIFGSKRTFVLSMFLVILAVIPLRCVVGVSEESMDVSERTPPMLVKKPTWTTNYVDSSGKTLKSVSTSASIPYPENQVSGYWLVPSKSFYTVTEGNKPPERYELQDFFQLFSPIPGGKSVLTQLIDFLNAQSIGANVTKLNMTFVYQIDQSVLKANDATFPVNSNINVASLVEQVKNVDGSNGNVSKVTMTGVVSSTVGKYEAILSYYDNIAGKSLTTRILITIVGELKLKSVPKEFDFGVVTIPGAEGSQSFAEIANFEGVTVMDTRGNGARWRLTVVVGEVPTSSENKTLSGLAYTNNLNEEVPLLLNESVIIQEGVTGAVPEQKVKWEKKQGISLHVKSYVYPGQYKGIFIWVLNDAP